MIEERSMIRRAIPKHIRQQVYEKCNGHCAYCGCELKYKDMQVDHIESVYRAEYLGGEADNSIENYMPSCRACNFYKGVNDLETFRRRLTEVLYDNLKKNFNYKLLLKYDQIKEDIHPVVFYFEKKEGTK